MHEVFDVVPCGILLFDDSGKILKANATLADWLGCAPQSLEGRTINTILSVASQIFYNTHFFPLIRLHSRVDEVFMTLVSGNNKSIPVLTNAVRRTTTHRIENVAVFMPVPARSKYEEEILRARRAAESALAENRELQILTEKLESHSRELEMQNQKIQSINEDLVQFNKVISHDLQEPIRKIRLFTDMVLRSSGESLSKRLRGIIEKIEAGAERLSDLTIGLHQYVKVNVEVQHTMVDLNDCIEIAASRVKQRRNFDDFQLSFNRFPSIEGSAAQLELLFYHLIDNAVQFRDTERKLVITVDHILLEENLYRSIPDKYSFVEHIRIVFSDNGIGFDNEFREQAFQFGKKIHLGRSGIGIGLALIRKIVANHRGTIAVKAETGKGTEIILLLPTRYSNR